MIKLAKWAYKMGVRAERQRIKLLIAEFRHDKPERPSDKNSTQLDNYNKRMSVYWETNYALNRLTDPGWGQSIEPQALAPIDEDWL